MIGSGLKFLNNKVSEVLSASVICTADLQSLPTNLCLKFEKVTLNMGPQCSLFFQDTMPLNGTKIFLFLVAKN